MSCSVWLWPPTGSGSRSPQGLSFRLRLVAFEAVQPSCIFRQAIANSSATFLNVQLGSVNRVLNRHGIIISTQSEVGI